MPQLLNVLQQDQVNGTYKALRALRTIMWFERLVILSDKKTPYAVGKLIQPEAYGKTKDETVYHHNLWPKYARGKHVPNQTLVDRAERMFAGSSSISDHVIFDALDPSRPIRQNVSRLLQRLRFDVQAIIFDEPSLKLGLFIRKEFSSLLFDEIAMCAHLDAVAALVILYREACEADGGGPGPSLAEALYRSLLATATISICAPFGRELAATVGQYIFPLGAFGGCGIRFDLALFEKQRAALEIIIEYLHKHKRIEFTVEDHLKAGNDILSGLIGQSLAHLFLPPLVYVQPDEEVTNDARICVETMKLLREWAWQTSMSGNFSSVIPEAVVDELIRLKEL